MTRTRGEQENEHETGASNTDGRSDVEGTAAMVVPFVQQCTTWIFAFLEEEGYFANCTVGEKTTLPPGDMFFT